VVTSYRMCDGRQCPQLLATDVAVWVASDRLCACDLASRCFDSLPVLEVVVAELAGSGLALEVVRLAGAQLLW
jgi:hypothetical protein